MFRDVFRIVRDILEHALLLLYIIVVKRWSGQSGCMTSGAFVWLRLMVILRGVVSDRLQPE